MMGKKEFHTFLLFSTILLILCMNNYRIDVYSVRGSLDNTYNMSEKCGIRTERLLTKYYVQKIIIYRVLGEKNKKKKNEEVKARTYEKITKESLNELDTYMRSYMHRYTKRKGLGKIDCICEKKIFDIIDKIDKSGICNKKKLKKKVHLKYGFGLFTTCLVPLFGIILPVLDKITDPRSSGSQKESILHYSGIPMEFSYIYIAFFLILSYIILVIIIYIIIKIVKYEKLKAKKGKMYFNEYCGFYKEVFSK